MKKNKIVFIDDEKDMVRLLQIELETEGYEVKSAFDGKSGLELIRGSIPDLVLLDVMMPDMSGYEVLKALRDDPLTRSLPVIMLTAKGLENEIQKGLDLGADEYIPKPFHPGLLIKRIQTLLSRD
ncbi:MAG: response regulator [Candidatus Omnitrophota bacterium]